MYYYRTRYGQNGTRRKMYINTNNLCIYRDVLFQDVNMEYLTKICAFILFYNTTVNARLI